MYHEYAKYFDKIFPAKDQIVAFLEKHLDGKRILDVGCGSGEYTIALHDKGYSVTGIDLDTEMIAYAKKKASAIYFKVENMLDMDDEIYDSLYCIGNTLVHLPTKKDIQTFLNSCYKKIEDGNIVLQIINYDRILEEHITSLPTIENEEVTFVRNYSHKEDKIVFSTILKTKDKRYENAVELIPLCKDELVEMLKEAGFKTINSYKGFSDAPYEKDSYALVIVASK